MTSEKRRELIELFETISIGARRKGQTSFTLISSKFSVSEEILEDFITWIEAYKNEALQEKDKEIGDLIEEAYYEGFAVGSMSNGKPASWSNNIDKQKINELISKYTNSK